MFFSTLFVSLLLSLADASPLARRQTVDCAPNSSTGLKAECWDSLKVDDYIQAWMKANGTAANCATLGFAQCYLQFNGLTTLTCDLITSDTCPPPSSTVAYSSDQHFYVSTPRQQGRHADILLPLTNLLPRRLFGTSTPSTSSSTSILPPSATASASPRRQSARSSPLSLPRSSPRRRRARC